MPKWEDELPPLAKSRLAGIGNTGPEERSLAKQREEVRTLLSDLYRDNLDARGLHRKLESATPFMIREAQLSLIESLSLSYDSRGFERRKAAILELESLKKNQRPGLIEDCLSKIGEMRRAYRGVQEEALQEVIEERSRDHQPTINPGRWIALHGTLSTDGDMVERLAESMLRAEQTYGDKFAATIRELTQLIDPGE